jgi:hypothetical protein
LLGCDSRPPQKWNIQNNHTIQIVEKIKTQLDEQKVIDRQIEEKLQTINKIIEDAIIKS